MSAEAALHRYNLVVIRASTKTFICPKCTVLILPKKFQEHCKNSHDINSRTHCVWCWGTKSWPSGKKQHNADHLIYCFKKFMQKLEEDINNNNNNNNEDGDNDPAAAAAIPFVLFDDTPMCQAKKFYGHKKIMSEKAYQTVCPLNLGDEYPRGLFFQNQNVNLAVSYLQYYFEFTTEKKDEMDAFHIMVKSNIYKNFYTAMIADKGRSHTLEFSCWCDGGRYQIHRYRQHKHMIVFSKPKGHFVPNVWKNIKTLDKPHKNFPSLRLKRIVSPMHLVNTIGYLSKRNSRCNFTFDRKLKKENLNHFYINLELPAEYNFMLVTQWEEGLPTLVKQKIDHSDRKKLVPHCKRVNGQQALQVKNTPNIELNRVLPVDKIFIPSKNNTPTDHFAHFKKGGKLYFEKMEKYYDDDDSWVQKQVVGGNLFYGVIANEFVIPRDQKFLSDVEYCMDKRFMELNDKIVKQNEEILKQNMEITRLQKTIHENEMNRLKSEIEHLKNGSKINNNNNPPLTINMNNHMNGDNNNNNNNHAK